MCLWAVSVENKGLLRQFGQIGRGFLDFWHSGKLGKFTDQSFEFINLLDDGGGALIEDTVFFFQYLRVTACAGAGRRAG